MSSVSELLGVLAQAVKDELGDRVTLPSLLACIRLTMELNAKRKVQSSNHQAQNIIRVLQTQSNRSRNGLVEKF
jgi:hypothetical protein